MIQRLQSLYLSLTTILSLLFLSGNVLTFINKSETLISITFRGIVRGAEGLEIEVIEKLMPLSVLIIIIPIIALITVFLYKNRQLQMKLALVLIMLVVVQIILLAFYSYGIIQEYNATLLPGLKMAIPILILIFNVLAYNGIRKDERLVKSYDRLR